MKSVLALFPSIILYGKERSNYEVFKILENNECFSLSIIANKKATFELKELLKDFNTTYITFPSRKGKFRFVRYLYRYVLSNLFMIYYMIRNKVDCIYLNDEMSVYDFFPILFFTKAKIIYRIGDAPAFPTLTGYKLNAFMWKSIVNDKVATVVSISNYIQSAIKQYGRDSINDCVIYNFPPSRTLTKNDELSMPRNARLVIGYLGQIVGIKGVHILVDAVIKMLKKNKDVVLYLAGSISVFPDYYQNLNKTIMDSGYADHIKFLGEINNVASFFENIDVLCVPTLVEEALGNVIVEAKLNNTPVVVFPSGGMPEIIENGIDGYVCAEKTAESIEEIMNLYYYNMDQILLQSKNSYLSLDKFGIKYENFKNRWNNLFIETLR